MGDSENGADVSVRANELIHPFSHEYDEYLRDESRSHGAAESISFPTTEDEVRSVLRALHPSRTPITIQGARTGLAAGAVPAAGHVLNLSRMNRCLGLRVDDAGKFYLRVQPGAVLLDIRKYLRAKDIPHAGWDEASLAALKRLSRAPEQVFVTDPTETSATVGGMAACNASGARSYRFGPMRFHVSALRMVLADGDVLALKRGELLAHGRNLDVVTEQGRTVHLDLPTYEMPRAKNASGYYSEPGMDAIDVAIGSDGTLGVISELELALQPAPAVTWGVSCFFTSERQALDAVVALRDGLSHAAAIEYFDSGALDIARAQRKGGSAFAALMEPPAHAACCVYVEIQADSEREAFDDLYACGAVAERAGGSERDTWVARSEVDRECLQFFRHAIPESVNMLIDQRRRDEPGITKLGSDMSVPNERLHDVMELYRTTLAQEGLQSAMWGHIGDNHLHVNVLPRSMEEYHRAKRLFERWAGEVTAMGGAVSAEHGVGKLKRSFLETMYGREHVREMARLKLALDPYGQFGRGNVFDERLLDAPAGGPCEGGASACDANGGACA